jgi:biotin carboxyl carrier protein
VSDADERGMRTVMCTLNGQLRPVSVRDRSVDAAVKAAEKADRSDPGQVAAPFAGVVTLQVKEGDSVDAGQPIATIEAMKMEAAITAPVTGTVNRAAIGQVTQVEGGDLLVVVRSALVRPGHDLPPCRCQELGHVMRPAHIRARCRRAGRRGVAGSLQAAASRRLLEPRRLWSPSVRGLDSVGVRPLSDRWWAVQNGCCDRPRRP